MNQVDIGLRKLLVNGKIGNIQSPLSLASIEAVIGLQEGVIQEGNFNYNENLEVYSKFSRIVRLNIKLDTITYKPPWMIIADIKWYEKLVSMSIEKLSEFSNINKIPHTLVDYYDGSKSIIFPDTAICILYRDIFCPSSIIFCFADYGTFFSPSTVVKAQKFICL